MTKKEYIQELAGYTVDSVQVTKIEKQYNALLPDMIKKIISNAAESVFFDDGSRVLSFDEIMDAEKDLHVKFSENEIIPLIDNGENDFIVYHLQDNMWSMFNIVDESIFMKKQSLEMLMGL